MGVIRVLFALAVVIGHSGNIFGYSMISGGLAVQSFYMISGFYMALVLNEKYINKDNSYKLFISSRLLRLYPTYWAVLACILLFSGICYFLSSGSDLGSTLNLYREYIGNMSLSTIVFLILTNIFIFFQDIVIFLGLDLQTGNLFLSPDISMTNPKVFNFLFIPQAWTVGVELLFYIIAPFLARRKLSLILVLIFLSIFLRFFLIYMGLGNDPKNYRFFPNELALFLSGVVAYKVYALIKKKKTNNRIAVTLFIIIILFTVFYNQISFYGEYVVFLVLLFVALPHIFLWTKNMKYDRLIGDFSYPIYICHIFVLSIIMKFDFNSSFFLNGGICLLVCFCSIVFSLILQKTIEVPLDKYRQRRIRTFKD